MSIGRDLEPGDKICVRPLGTLSVLWGTFVSIDRDKGIVTFWAIDGQLQQKHYGNIYNYGKEE